MEALTAVSVACLTLYDMLKQDSSLLSVFAGAQALIVRAPDAPEAPAGALVDVLYP